MTLPDKKKCETSCVKPAKSLQEENPEKILKDNQLGNRLPQPTNIFNPEAAVTKASSLLLSQKKTTEFLLNRARNILANSFQTHQAYFQLENKDEFWMRFDWAWSVTLCECVSASLELGMDHHQLLYNAHSYVWKFRNTVSQFFWQAVNCSIVERERRRQEQLKTEFKLKEYHDSTETLNKSLLYLKARKNRNMLGKRCNFSREQVLILNRWLGEHSDNPYPTQAEKIQLSEQTNLSVKQVANWFINTRARGKKRKTSKEEEDQMPQSPVDSK
mmetsp:Transcript_27735/g.38580  ORF Transcript_27735/g.38580 Transcript_27735/m.38580 type:complete len:273 (-) Transcript_27735:509-1327(-)